MKANYIIVQYDQRTSQNNNLKLISNLKLLLFASELYPLNIILIISKQRLNR